MTPRQAAPVVYVLSAVAIVASIASIAAIALALAGCGTAAPDLPQHQSVAPQRPLTASPALTIAPYQTGGRRPAAAIPEPSTATPAPATPGPSGYALPDRTLTPGAGTNDLAQICPHVDPAIEAARPSAAAKTRVYAAYGIPAGQRHLYVVDHLVSLSVGGENVQANEWPQPVAQAKAKDRVEAALHTWVCAHPGQLAAAQRAEAANWATALDTLGVAP
jgi:hypothetical protein